jgi:hypothetical protein
MRKDRTKLQINRQLRRRPLLDQIRPHGLVSSLAAISLDYLISDLAFKSTEERRQSVISSIRFGQSDAQGIVSPIRAAIGLARKYAENGQAVAKQIEYGFQTDANRIPAEIIADYVVRVSNSDALFNTARALERASASDVVPPFDRLDVESRSWLGVVLDFNAISREKVALAWTGITTSPPSRGLGPKSQAKAGPLFTEASQTPIQPKE